MISRPKISQNDLDLTELESIKLWAGARGSLFDFSTGTVHLNYEPVFYEDPKMCLVVKKANECVGCGVAKPLTRFYIVPYRFRRCFPVEHKSNNSHDIVPLCLRCRYDVEPRYRDLEKRLEASLPRRSTKGPASEDDRPRATKTPEDARRGARNVAKALLRSSKIPEDRRRVLLRSIADARNLDVDSLDLDALEAIAAENPKDDTPKKKVKVDKDDDSFEARAVRALLEGAADKDDVADRVHKFQMDWRQAFVDALDPKFLPDGWTVDHSQRPRPRPPSKDMPCRAFRNGKCAWGDNCRYKHDAP